MSQLEITFEDKLEEDIPVLSSLAFGKLFRVYGKGKNTYMKVKTVNFLNNSEVLSDIFSRGDCIVVSLERGTVNYMKGSTKIIPLVGHLRVGFA